jgi:hypothetical protein
LRSIVRAVLPSFVMRVTAQSGQREHRQLIVCVICGPTDFSVRTRRGNRSSFLANDAAVSHIRRRLANLQGPHTVMKCIIWRNFVQYTQNANGHRLMHRCQSQMSQTRTYRSTCRFSPPLEYSGSSLREQLQQRCNETLKGAAAPRNRELKLMHVYSAIPVW